MLAKTPLRDLIIAWLEQQDPETTYDWANPYHCACARVASALNRKHDWLELNHDGFASVRNRTQEWCELNELARGDILGEERAEWTYGAFLQRLKR